MDTPDHHYWFPAKRYGYGWGFPATWQGWVVLVVWIAIELAGSFWAVSLSLVFFYVFQVIMGGILLAICYIKGEPPRWRWGDKA
ncbi:MAG TPA: hypothetical protein DCM28_22485 [Phycisphaerales bacterium]|nr:hypothetical protein [Phycisphaerales bacterium]HCD31724.1 hypothetical protein [Phycisphaerales bacterium]|tara:strand:+ start:938 stop:1189 length:252 start_codon:yes stop_codon:yes gene_type:complete